MAERRGTTAQAERRETDLAASYNAMLLARPELAQRTYEELIAAEEATGLVVGGRYLCNVLRPRFVRAGRAEVLAHVATVLAGIFERAGECLLADDVLLDLIWASEQERAVWEIDPGFTGFTTTSRLDAFMVDDQPRFVEYNAESPASIGFCDVLTETFLGLPAMREWAGETRLRGFAARQELTDLLLSAFREWGGASSPSIAVIDWDDVLTKRDFELCAEYFRAQGYPTIICDPRSLEYRGGRLSYKGEPVTLVYRRVLLHELLEKADEARPVLDAYREGAVCMVNCPRSKLLHKKAVMALLSEGRLPLSLSPEERSIVEATIPWTRRVGEGDTSYGDETVDLPGFILENQERMALKPSDDYGGRGVVLGWDTTAEGWQTALERALGGGYVVQERVPVPEAEFPVWDDGEVRVVPLYVDVDPLLFRGRMGGVLTRLSGSPLLNVSAGTGSTAPTFVVDEEE